MRLLFAYPFFLGESALEQRWLTPYPPLGLLYLAAAARQAGHTVAVFDGTFQPGREAFALACRDFDPEVVCLATLITLRPTTLRLAEMARASGAAVIAGGADASNDPEAYLRPGGLIRTAAVGEGEETLVELLDALASGPALEGVKGIAFAGSDGKVRRTSPRPPIAELDALPPPARDLVDLPAYFRLWREAHGYTSMALAASRGCPFGCEHCANSAVSPHWRARRPEAVAAEMRMLQERYAPDCFRLVDDLDGLGRDWLLALGEAMMASGVTTPYEGLRLHVKLGDLPMLDRRKELCAERNAWIPKAAQHPHAPPGLNESEMQMRWSEARLPEGVALAEP
ncbi:MAG: cobalamin B12-binding domain-containing protein [Chloroflexi bacterium]|nr:cobalamin B12-binding domain-containing protein [Chloroflexota bacterium]